MAAQSSPTIIATTIADLRGHAPFDDMDDGSLTRFVTNLTLRYFAQGSVIISPQDGVVTRLLIVQRGQVRGDIDTASSDERPLVMSEGEMFPVGAMISRHPTVLTFSAATDVFCYELHEAGFGAAMDGSREFRNFATTRLAHLLESSRQDIQSTFGRRLAGAQTMASPLRAISRHELATVAPTTSIRSVLALMQERKIGSVIIVDTESGRPEGIFTEHDVLTRVALPQVDQAGAISTVMTANPFSLPANATVFEAAKMMAERGFRHVLVTDEGRLSGIVSEHDLFQLQRLSLGGIAKSIDRCVDGDALAAAAAEVRHMSVALLGQGVAAEQLTQFVTTMNDAIVGRALALAAQFVAPPDVAWCWIGLGSEGRMEQTLVTDQDNAIIFADDPARDGPATEATRAALLQFAARANALLDQAGFPLCRGDIMAKNPKWCLSATEWRAVFVHWLSGASPQALLNAAIFFDFRALHGDTELAAALREWLTEVLAAPAGAHKSFLRNMAANALDVRPPLGLLRDFVDVDAAHPGTIDLKKFGARPFIDAARILALIHGVRATNTADRLRSAMRHMHVAIEEVNAYVDAFHFIQLLRLRNAEAMAHQAGQHAGAAHLTTGEADANPNRVVIESLNELDRRILKEALRQARKLQSRLELDFQL